MAVADETFLYSRTIKVIDQLQTSQMMRRELQKILEWEFALEALNAE